MNLTGQQFGRLTVIGFEEYRKRSDGHNNGFWRCVCQCGQESLVSTSNLTSGAVKSCGCLRVERTKESNTVHGFRSRKDKVPRLYRIWSCMKTRCYNKNVKTTNIMEAEVFPYAMNGGMTLQLFASGLWITGTVIALHLTELTPTGTIVLAIAVGLQLKSKEIISDRPFSLKSMVFANHCRSGLKIPEYQGKNSILAGVMTTGDMLSLRQPLNWNNST